ncbi:MAG: 50S ribosomal protein L23 [Candidatus Shapirobacteria bacterium]|jgi:large subunit ribosomal protein L23
MIKMIPIITEKSVALQSSGVYAFWVDLGASKSEIRVAFKDQFAVTPISINTTIVRGKLKTNWKNRSKIVRSDRKKAIITVGAKNKIDSLQFKPKK